MIWIAPSEKDTASAALENRLWDAAEQAGAAPHYDLKFQEYSGGRPLGPVLGLICLRFAAKRAQLESPAPLGGESAGVRA